MAGVGVMAVSIKILRAGLDLLPYGLLLAGRFVLLWLFGDDAGLPSWVLIQLLFSLFLFYAFSCLIHPAYAALSSLLTEALLVEANAIKVGHTGVPVSARDLVEVGQAASLTGYASVGMYVTVVLLALAVFLGWKYRVRGWRSWLGRLPFGLPLMLLIWLFAFSDGAVSVQGREFLCRAHICYYSWNPVFNSRKNGALAHLLMTSEAIRTPAKSDHDFYRHEQLPSTLQPSRPDLIMILCESCFTTLDGRFDTSMKLLADDGLMPFSLLSPVYGGNTPEAEFETITGLSSAVFPGVDYQNFFDRYRTDSDTLPRRFRDAGYFAASLHNFKSDFWRRNFVHPLLGFQKSVFIDDMDPGGMLLNGLRISDDILYSSALDLYEKIPNGQPVFLYLITMHTHGDYAVRNNDFGESDYRQRLSESMEDMREFLKRIRLAAQGRKRPLAIVIFGDHKPALSRVFYNTGVFPARLFDAPIAEQGNPGFVLQPSYVLWKERARVSAFAWLPAGDRETKEFVDRLNDKPMFCLPAELSGLVEGRDNAFWSSVNGICQQPDAVFSGEKGNPWGRFFPEGIYAERLF
ncbi:LTA synthase family protein [Castellaniella hirudinis]|uniref:LTA synthase family protein n=1 Tax=Castellaniella hirudinis TaxID=1144617 RepID=UPI0039C31C12